MPAATQKRMQTTTVRLPRRLYEAARCAVKTGATEAGSFNDLLIDSLQEKLRQLKQAQIDAAFADMRNDPNYRKVAETLAEEFAANDRQTLEFTNEKE